MTSQFLIRNAASSAIGAAMSPAPVANLKTPSQITATAGQRFPSTTLDRASGGNV